MPLRPPAARPARPRDPSWREDKRSASARGYGSRWRKARATYLATHPLCVMCEAQGTVTPATVVDHRTPHRGDQQLFWDTSNWQALCQPHHSGAKQAEERSGKVRGCDADGWPIAREGGDV